MKTLLLATVMMTAMLSASPVVALTANAFMSGNDLLSMCSGLYDGPSVCSGYIAGVFDALSVAVKLETGRDAACSTIGAMGVNGGQMRDVVIKYLKAHPEHRHEPAAQLVRTALGEAFHCSW